MGYRVGNHLVDTEILFNRESSYEGCYIIFLASLVFESLRTKVVCDFFFKFVILFFRIVYSLRTEKVF